MRGLSIDIQVPRLEECGRCRGKGAEPEDGLTTCPICRGKGEVIYQQAFLSVRRTCNQCGGRGQIIRRPCKECKGEGYLRRERKLKVNIPAGVDDGTQLRLSQEGQPGVNGGATGRSVRGAQGEGPPHLRAPRRQPALHRAHQRGAGRAGRVGRYSYAGRSADRQDSGRLAGRQRLRIKGLGVPHVNGSGRGDMFVHLDVRIPTKLSREQRKLFEQLRELLPAENEPTEKGIFDKVKDYFM